ncbi:hypothetical protein [Phyllobacterium sp. YR531]|nr:hypothetical protein [Phyllobacterium sp. YR531]EJN02377.1 hypothetical protein PMI41_03129 [Phyllobacterium sp. YR531]
MAKRIDAQDAKQGKQGYPVLVVLTVSLGLAALIWLGVEVYGQFIAHGG